DALLDRQLAGRRPQVREVALRREQSHQRAEQRGLAGAIGANDRDDRPRGDRKRDAAHGLDFAVRDVQIAHVEQRLPATDAHHATPPRYASSTAGLLWMSAGNPSASFWPNSITTRRSVRPITNSMSCSTSSTVMPSALSCRNSVASSCFSR